MRLINARELKHTAVLLVLVLILGGMGGCKIIYSSKETINSSEDVEKNAIEDVENEDATSVGSNIENSIEDGKADDTKTGDTKEADTKVEDSRDEDIKVEDPKDEDIKVEDSKDEDIKVENSVVVEDDTESSVTQAPEEDRFSLYISLLFQYIEDVDRILGEVSEKTEEEAFDYKKAGIRVWFDRGEADQIWTEDETIDFNGAHVGDDIQEFIEVFGEPTQDVNGEAHFTYEGCYLVMQYDTSSGEVVGVYLLTEDYGYE